MNDDYRISHRAPSFDEEGTTVRLVQVGGTYDEAIRQVRGAAQSGDPDHLVAVY